MSLPNSVPSDSFKPELIPLTMKDVARRFGVSVRTIQIWTKEKKILQPKQPWGRRTRTWHPEEFEEWFDRVHRTQGVSELETEAAPVNECSTAEAAALPSPQRLPNLVSAAAVSRLEPSNAVRRMQERGKQKRLDAFM